MATTDKYDRQLRLWGASGQKRLGETSVVLLQATAAGCETLKNLILPGIGAFVAVDLVDAGATQTDAASNFFVPLPREEEYPASPPKSRAEIVAESLQELNEDVRGGYQLVNDWLSTDYEALLRGCVAAASPCTRALAVASDLEPPALERAARACDALHVPLIVVQSYGLLGCVRVQTPPLPLLEPQPRSGSAVPDLRLSNPFPALQQFADGFDLSQLEDHQHGHVPYPVILLKAVGRWKLKHGGGNALPATASEKQTFQSLVKQMARNLDHELNVQEAVQNAYLAYSSRELDVRELAQRVRELEASAAGNIPSIRRFRALLDALDTFAAKHGRAPVSGVVPDLTASTDWYVALQNVYKRQAQDDLRELRALLDPAEAAEVEDEELESLVRNAFDLDVLHPRTIAEEWNDAVEVPDDVCDDLAMATMEGDERDDQLPLLWGLGLGACRRFYGKHGRYPGIVDDWESDVDDLQSCLVEVVRRYKLLDNELVRKTLLKSNDYAIELARYGNAEVHNVASLIGGVASQEAVKIVTSQYVPIDHTYVYNGIASIGGVYRF